MKITQLITDLQKIQDKHGDLDVDLWADELEEASEFAGVATVMNIGNKATGVTLCGPETLLAFSDSD